MKLKFRMLRNLASWTPRSKPQRVILEGQYVRLEPLNAEKHEQSLFEASTPPDLEKRFFYMLTTPSKDRKDFSVSQSFTMRNFLK